MATAQIAQLPNTGCSVVMTAALVAGSRHLEPAELASEVVLLVVVSVRTSIFQMVVCSRSALADVVIVGCATVRVRSSAVAGATTDRIFASVSRYSVSSAVVGVLPDAISVTSAVAMCQVGVLMTKVR